MILIDKKSGKHYENVAPGIINAKIKADPERWGFAEEITEEEAEKELKEAPKKRKRRTKAEIEADKLKENK